MQRSPYSWSWWSVMFYSSCMLPTTHLSKPWIHSIIKSLFPYFCSRTCPLQIFTVYGIPVTCCSASSWPCSASSSPGSWQAFFIRTDPAWESLSRQATAAVPLSWVSPLYRTSTETPAWLPWWSWVRFPCTISLPYWSCPSPDLMRRASIKNPCWNP